MDRWLQRDDEVMVMFTMIFTPCIGWKDVIGRVSLLCLEWLELTVDAKLSDTVMLKSA